MKSLSRSFNLVMASSNHPFFVTNCRLFQGRISAGVSGQDIVKANADVCTQMILKVL
jgi:hypothetical protein